MLLRYEMDEMSCWIAPGLVGVSVVAMDFAAAKN